MPDLRDLMVDPDTLALGESGPAPLLFVDLERCSVPITTVLPPIPVIGIGARSHPAAAALDAIVEPPVSGEMLIAAVSRMPQAAAVAVQVLRAIGGVAIPAALTMESMAYGLLQGSAEHRRWLDARTAGPSIPPGRVIVMRDGAVLRIVMDRPQAHNAIDRAMRDDLHAAFSLAAIDPEIARVELRATGSAFSIGGDLGEFGTTRDPAAAHLIRARTLPATAIAQRRSVLHAHVQGACVGAGLEMAAFAQALTAGPRAWFQLPELGMGLIPGAGGCVSVSRRIGRQRAALLILSGRRIGAVTALEWGLIDAIQDLPPVDPGRADAD